jgi:branched-chain amino acid aminotransferase
MTKCILNDRIINLDQAQIHVSDLALLRAYGIFDFFRLVGLQPLFIDDHIERFFASADHLRLPCPIGRQHLQDLIMQLIGINQIPNSGIRLVLTGGESDTGYSIGTPTLFVLNEPINPLPQQHFAQGIKLLSYEYQRDIPEVKTINYLVGIYKLPEVIFT